MVECLHTSGETFDWVLRQLRKLSPEKKCVGSGLPRR